MKHVYTIDDLREKALPVNAKLAVLGYPVSHSASPQMHQAALDALGIDACYIRLEIEPGNVSEAFGLMQSPPPYEKYPMRVTFLIGADRKILGVWNDIDVSTHSEDVVSFVLEVLDKAG